MDVKPFRWTAHAHASLLDREIDPVEAHRTLHEPQVVLPGRHDRRLYVHLYLIGFWLKTCCFVPWSKRQ